jgi:hypothetical protein
MDTWRELKIKLAEVKSEGNVKALGTQPPSFDGFISWTLLHHQFEAMSEHNCTAQEKATHLLATCRYRALTFYTAELIPLAQ